MKLQSYVSGTWKAGTGVGRPLVNPVSGEEIARCDAGGVDLSAAIVHARTIGGGHLRSMTFAQRSALLKAVAEVLQAKRADYFATALLNSGNTADDASIDIDGAIYTLKTYARLGASLGDARSLVEAGQEQLARDPIFFSRHFWTPRPGVALQINAFNFPSWGMWEKVAQALLAGVPSIAKPATATAMLSEQMVRDVIEAGVLPEGALSLVCGSVSGLAQLLGPMDSVAFTGSAATAAILRREFAGMAAAPRLTVEADSINATVVGADAVAGSAIFDLAVREALKALSVKAGQLCTNIRRIIVPATLADDFTEALAAKVRNLAVGDPASATTRVGPLINAAQRQEAEANIGRLEAETRIVARAALPETPPQSGFVAPTLMRCDNPLEAQSVHEVEVFGPCATILPYRDTSEAVALVRKAEGSLALSLFSNDHGLQTGIVSDMAAWHGRLMLVDDEVGKAHTGHFNVMPQCVHGGPGRAGDGEELGGLRGLRFHMQRSAVQAGPSALSALADMAVEATL